MLDTLLLFDIDGTLIVGSRAARVAFSRAIQTCQGVTVDLSALESAGKTDYQIMKDILDVHGLRSTTADWQALQVAFLEHFAEAVRLDPGQICPGVRPLLDALDRRPHTVLGLGTGNLEQSARMKLAAHGLEGYFETGGFGDDGVDRDAIIAAGIVRAQTRYGCRFDRIAVIGDTPHDIACARANDVHSLGVATGPFPVEALTAAGATVTLADLTQTDAVIEALVALPRSHHR